MLPADFTAFLIFSCADFRGRFIYFHFHYIDIRLNHFVLDVCNALLSLYHTIFISRLALSLSLLIIDFFIKIFFWGNLLKKVCKVRNLQNIFVHILCPC